MGSGLNARRDMFGHDRLGQAQPAHAHSTQKTASLSSHHTSRQIFQESVKLFFSRGINLFTYTLLTGGLGSLLDPGLSRLAVDGQLLPAPRLDTQAWAEQQQDGEVEHH